MKSLCQCGRPSRLPEATIRSRASSDYPRACDRCAELESEGYDRFSAPVGKREPKRHRVGGYQAIINACDKLLAARGIKGGRP